MARRPITMHYPVFPGVSLLRLPWTNAWLLAHGRDAVLVDCGTRWDRGLLLAMLRRALPHDFRLHAVLLTHGHCDHAGNAAFFAERFDSQVVAHAAEAPFLATRRTYVPPGWGAVSLRGALFALGEGVFPVRRRAVGRIVEDGERVETPLGALTVVHTPGHTPGHACYFHEREGWLFSGDALLNVIPFVRREGLSMAPPVFSRDMAGARQSVRRIAEVGPAVLLAGHGGPLRERTAEAIHDYAKGLRLSDI